MIRKKVLVTEDFRSRLWCWIQGLGCRIKILVQVKVVVLDSGFRVWGLRLQGTGCRVWGVGQQDYSVDVAYAPETKP
jgi:hypothetical protein